jgi:hypothetical protein
LPSRVSCRIEALVTRSSRRRPRFNVIPMTLSIPRHRTGAISSTSSHHRLRFGVIALTLLIRLIAPKPSLLCQRTDAPVSMSSHRRAHFYVRAVMLLIRRHRTGAISSASSHRGVRFGVIAPTPSHGTIAIERAAAGDRPFISGRRVMWFLHS